MFVGVMDKFTNDEMHRLLTEDGSAWVEQFRAVVTKANEYGILHELYVSLVGLDSYQGRDEDDEDYRW